MTGSEAGTGRLAMAAGWLVGFAVGWNFANVSADAPGLADDYGVGLAAIGMLTTIVVLGHTLVQLPAGRAADRLGARRVATIGLTVTVAGNGIALVDDRLWVALAGRGITGLGTGYTFLAVLDYLRRRGGSPLVQGIYGGIPGLAGGMALGLIPQIEPWLGWRGPYLTALALTAAGLLLLTAAPSEPEHAGGSHGVPHPRGKAWELVRDRRMIRLAILNLTGSGLTQVAAAWVVSLLVRANGYSAAAAGAVGSLVVLGSVVSRPFGGFILHNHRQLMRPTLALSIVMGSGGVAALAVGSPLAVAIAGSALVGGASGLPWAYAFTGAAHVRSDAPGVALAVINTAGLVVFVIGVPLVGLTFSLPGDGRIGFAVVSALWALSILAVGRRQRDVA